jgi:hypothetical protein
VTVASGTFPVIAFGHGFVMGIDSYENLWTALVAEGFIVAMVNTETGFSPSHNNFGKDLAFIIDQITQENTNNGSVLFNAVSSMSAVMGHSMGGGASFLAIANNNNIDAMVTLAPAETNPSAIAASSSIGIPRLILAGSNDCVTPIADHQQPMQDALTSNCKTLAVIAGAGHCQFANYNFNCSFGELTCGTPATLSETEQHDASTDLMIPWLNYYLKNDCSAGELFQLNLGNASLYSSQQNCSLLCTEISNSISPSLKIYPNPSHQDFFVEMSIPFGQLQVFNPMGQIVLEKLMHSSERINCEQWTNGLYYFKITDMDHHIGYQKLLIIHNE